MHSGGFELAKLTSTRLEDNLIRHRGDRLTYLVPAKGLGLGLGYPVPGHHHGMGGEGPYLGLFVPRMTPSRRRHLPLGGLPTHNFTKQSFRLRGSLSDDGHGCRRDHGDRGSEEGAITLYATIQKYVIQGLRSAGG